MNLYCLKIVLIKNLDMSNLWCVFLLNNPKKPKNRVFWGIPLF